MLIATGKEKRTLLLPIALLLLLTSRLLIIEQRWNVPLLKMKKMHRIIAAVDLLAP